MAGAAQPAATADSDTKSMIGTWRSVSLDHGDFYEWRGAKSIEIYFRSPDDIDLVLVLENGERRFAYDSMPGSFNKKTRTLFFGPIGSGLLFKVRRDPDSTNVKIELGTDQTNIKAELKRIGKPPESRPDLKIHSLPGQLEIESANKAR